MTTFGAVVRASAAVTGARVVLSLSRVAWCLHRQDRTIIMVSSQRMSAEEPVHPRTVHLRFRIRWHCFSKTTAMPPPQQPHILTILSPDILQIRRLMVYQCHGAAILVLTCGRIRYPTIRITGAAQYRLRSPSTSEQPYLWLMVVG